MSKNYIGVSVRGKGDNILYLDEDVQELIVEKTKNRVREELVEKASSGSKADLAGVLMAIDSNSAMDDLFVKHLSFVANGMNTPYFDGCESYNAYKDENITAYIDNVLTPLRNDEEIMAALMGAMKHLSGGE
jgi:hypothetical protein